MSNLYHLDVIAVEAFSGDYRRTGVLSTGELLYVALASGRMRELAPGDSIAYAVDRVGTEWMAHMFQQWHGAGQPKDTLVPTNCEAVETKDKEDLIHPALKALRIAAAVRGYYLNKMPGGNFGVYKKLGALVEPVAAWVQFKEVANLCGATGTITLRDALERDGLTWPESPDEFLASFYGK